MAILTWERAHGRVLVTHDLDFGAILADTEAVGPSVIQIRVQDLLAPEAAETIVNAVEVASPAILRGACQLDEAGCFQALLDRSQLREEADFQFVVPGVAGRHQQETRRAPGHDTLIRRVAEPSIRWG